MESSGLTENLGLLRLIPLIPLLGSVLNIFFGCRLGRKVAGLLACVAVGLSFLLSLWLFLSLPVGKIYQDTLFTWIESGLFKVEISFQADPLTVIMLFNPGMPEKGHRFWRGLGFVGAVLLALELIALFLPLRGQNNSSGGPQVGEAFGSPKMLAESLFTDFVLPFEIASILLLVALIGAVVLAKREP